MSMESIAGIVIGIAGLLIGIWGAVIARKQTFISDHLRKTMEGINDNRIREVWTQILIDLTAFDALDEARKEFLEPNPDMSEIKRKIESSRRATIDLFRMLLCNAAELEPVYNEETIEKWVSAGRLENEWRRRVARQLLKTSDIHSPGKQ